MALEEIVDITSTRQPDGRGGLEEQFRVIFTTEETSGTHFVEVGGEEFTPELARERARARAAEIDEAFTQDTGEE
jgi:hypothetical protein